MPHPTKKITPLNIDKSMLKKLFHKNMQAIKIYWPIILISHAFICTTFFLLSSQKPIVQVADQKNIEINPKQAALIKNLEGRFNELNKRFAALQIQHAKFIKSSIQLASTVQQNKSLPAATNREKTILDTIDRIGEKIRLNEPFSGLLASLPNECNGFDGYATLYRFSTHLPLTFVQLKNAFEDIKKNYSPQKEKSSLPKWLEKVASLFQGKIKIEKTSQISESPLQSIIDALEAQDLRLAHSLAKSFQAQPITLWAKHAAERILLDQEYAVFAGKVQTWIQQTTLKNETPPNTTKETFP